MDRFAAIESVTNRHAPVLEQLVLCDFTAGGHFARHVRKMREAYAERLAFLLEAARERLDGLLEVTPLDRFALGAVGDLERGLHIGFAAIDPAEIRRGVRDLGAAIEGLRRTAR